MLLISGGFALSDAFAFSVSDLFPQREDIGTEWRIGEPYSGGGICDVGLKETSSKKYFSGEGFSEHRLNINISQLNSDFSAKSCFSKTISTWYDYGGYVEWIPKQNSVNADECYGKIAESMSNHDVFGHKITLFCVKDDFVVMAQVRGHSLGDMYQAESLFVDSVFTNSEKISSPATSKYLSSEPYLQNESVITENEYPISSFIENDPLTACINNLDTPYKISGTFELVIDGQKLAIPAKVGFNDDSCQRTMYTLSDDGLIYAEWKEEYPFEIGHLFWIWNLPMNDIDQEQSIVFVDGIKSVFSIHTPFNDGSNYEIILNSKNYLTNQKSDLDSDLIKCGVGTIDNNGQCVPDPAYKPLPQTNSKGGGCLIATATYGSELAPQVQQLRELRDNQLLQTESGTNFMNSFNDVYYSFSPIIADYERENPVFREMVKVAITPMIASLSLMEYADSEESVLGIGISLIILNGMMYVGLPVLAVMRFRT